MKRLMWIFALVPVAVTGIVLQFMPDTIPMHYDMSGSIDRWGSKMESFILPAAILLITLFWHLMIHAFEAKASRADSEKEQMEAKSAAKILCIVGLSQAVMFGIMQYFILYSSYVQAGTGSAEATIDIAKVSCILCGIVFVVLGNFMTRVKKNAVVGIRTPWSMYNDNTWRKSNYFGAVCFIIAGVLTIVTAAFVSGTTSTIFLLVYILAASVIAVIYSKKVYNLERKSEK